MQSINLTHLFTGILARNGIKLPFQVRHDIKLLNLHKTRRLKRIKQEDLQE